MADHNMPFEIQVEIIKRLPVKSVLQFRSVSKAWKSLIDSSKFIAGYSGGHTQPQRLLMRYENPTESELTPQRLLMRYENPIESELKYVSIADDDTLAQQNLTPTVLILLLNDSRIVGSSHGLLCLYGYYGDISYYLPKSGSEMAVIWNPSIRKSVVIPVPNVSYSPYETVLGFGVCPATSDPKIVKITHVSMWGEMGSIATIPRQVQVFNLSSGGWRNTCSNLPQKSIEFTWFQVAIDGTIYWFCYDRIPEDGGFRTCNLIMSFDMTSEEFRVVDLPGSLANQPAKFLSISKLWESLAVIEYRISNEKQVCDIWKMEYGVPSSFTKLFSIRAPHLSIKTLGFRKNGEAIIAMQYDYKNDVGRAAVAVYEPYSEHTIDLGIYAYACSFFVSSYMETLLLLDQLDQTDSTIHSYIIRGRR